MIFNTANIGMTDGSTRSLSDVGLAYDATALGLATAATGVVTIAVQEHDRKAQKFMISAEGGRMFVRPRKVEGVFDPAAGKIASGTVLGFSNRSIGMFAPIILDLDGDGVEIVRSSKSKAMFDMDGNGTRDDTGWVGKGDGILVIDRDGDGRITTNVELSFLTEKKDATGNFDGLAVLDANKDGKISVADARFGELKIWTDGNCNGITEDGELGTLNDLGIAEISIRATAAQASADRIGSNLMLATATFTRADGRVSTLAETALAFIPRKVAPTLSADDKVARFRENEAMLPRRIEGETGFAMTADTGSEDVGQGSAPNVASVGASMFRDDHRSGPAIRAIDGFDWSYFDRLSAGDPGTNMMPWASGEGAGLPEVADPRLLQMVQAMNGFGATSAAALDRLSRADAASYDYFASAA